MVRPSQINNAGIYDGTDGSGLSDALNLLDINYYGVKIVTKALLPLLRPSEAGARIINVSSCGGNLEVSTSNGEDTA